MPDDRPASELMPVPQHGEPTRLRQLISRIEAAFGAHGPSAEASTREKSSNELAVARTDLATDRSLMATDRTLMAWIRTALSMISFGFAIYKLLQDFEAAGTELGRGSSPRAMGLFLTGMGTVSMVLGTIEYWYRRKDLQRYRHVEIWRPSFVIALLMSVTGLFLFIAILAKAL
jgi:putative membrane protein